MDDSDRRSGQPGGQGRRGPGEGPGAAAASPTYQALAESFTARLDQLLSSRRLLIRAWRDLGRCWPNWFDAESVAATEARLHRDIEALEARRQHWALRCSPQDPGFWIAVYDRLARISEDSGQVHPDSSEHRDLLSLARRYRQRQQAWQRGAIESAAAE